ncbi:MAG: GspH family T2SS minor pseudopilin variant ExeH [Wenzhouxiangellaceae bacterium]
MSAGLRSDHGFTLIELLVGLVIIAVVATAVSLTLGRDRGPQRLLQSAQRMQAMITTHCRQAAILQGQVIGLLVDGESYQFLTQQDEYWLPAAGLEATDLPAGIQAWTWLDGQPVRPDLSRDELPRPQVLCLPSGEMTPFSIRLQLATPATVVHLEGAGGGDLRLLHDAL